MKNKEYYICRICYRICKSVKINLFFTDYNVCKKCFKPLKNKKIKSAKDLIGEENENE